jgi:hypothetical protein
MEPGLGGATYWGDAAINARFSYTYDNACASSTCCGVPFNTYGHGYQYARTGVAYAAIFSVEDDGTPLDSNSRFYLQTKLAVPLNANHNYYIEFYLNSENFYITATNNVGLLVGDTAIVSYNTKYTPATPQILQYGNPIIADTLNWVRVGGVYKAHGGEQYITIGNFKDDAHTDTIHAVSVGNPEACYEIDDVSVIPLDSMFLYADAGRDTTIKKGDSVFIGSRLCGLTNVVWYDSAGAVIDTGAPGFWVSPAASTYYIITQNVNGFYSADTVYITVLNPLPVSITNYQLRITDGDEVVNSWQTATELNTSYFIVQHSVDSKNFTDIGTVKAVGSGANSYQFVDNDPTGGVNYYRLKSVDKDGKTFFSKVVSASLTTDNSPLITIYPNPTKGEVNIALPSNGNWQIVITDITGRVITKQSCNGYEGSTKLSLAGAKGLYLVKITNTATGQQIVKKITLQ